MTAVARHEAGDVVGEHTREILGEMGYGAADIEKLTASGAVACYGD